MSVAEDSVPITTERSCNAECLAFEAERPFVIGLVAKDSNENDSGPEHIGTRRQQMGYGGVFVQIGGWGRRDPRRQHCRLAVPGHPHGTGGQVPPRGGQPAGRARFCAFESMGEPEGWDKAAFHASDWPQAVVSSEREVRPKNGYARIDRVEVARLIWRASLDQSNILLCRVTVE